MGWSLRPRPIWQLAQVALGFLALVGVIAAGPSATPKVDVPSQLLTLIGLQRGAEGSAEWEPATFDVEAGPGDMTVGELPDVTFAPGDVAPDEPITTRNGVEADWLPGEKP